MLLDNGVVDTFGSTAATNFLTLRVAEGIRALFASAALQVLLMVNYATSGHQGRWLNKYLRNNQPATTARRNTLVVMPAFARAFTLP
jgi:hypothetical protein